MKGYQGTSGNVRAYQRIPQVTRIYQGISGISWHIRVYQEIPGISGENGGYKGIPDDTKGCKIFTRV